MNELRKTENGSHLNAGKHTKEAANTTFAPKGNKPLFYTDAKSRIILTEPRALDAMNDRDYGVCMQLIEDGYLVIKRGEDS